MAEKKHTDFSALVKNFAGEDGNISSDKIDALVSTIRAAVEQEYVTRERYGAKLLEIRELKETQQLAEDNAATAPDWKKKYQDEHTAFENYKTEITAKETFSAKQNAYRELLTDANISEKYREKVLKYTDLSGVELDEKGKVKGAAALLRSIREEWPEYIETQTEGSNINIPKPPENTGGGTSLTREDILNIKDTEARQKAIGDNLALFGEI